MLADLGEHLLHNDELIRHEWEVPCELSWAAVSFDVQNGIREGKQISDLISDLKKPAESQEIRLKINVEDFKEYGNKVLDDFREFVNTDECFSTVEKNFEGVRVNYNDGEIKGWMLIRLSLHDPVIPLNFESDMDGGVEKIWNRLDGFLSKYDKLSRS